jgi:ATP-dependent protease HslVU (ClpYQ) ATPase subunit
MLAELQGRLPIRVELKGLTREVRQPNLQIYTNHGVVIMDIGLFSLLNSSQLQAYIRLWNVWG